MRNPNLSRNYGSSERKIEERISEEENVRKLRELLETQLTEIKERIPGLKNIVDDSCRIEPRAFSKIYSEEVIEKDIKNTENKEIRFYFEFLLRKEGAKISRDQIDEYIEKLEEQERKKFLKKAREWKLTTKGEQLEMFKTLMFNKFLESNYCSLRTSFYDDTKNGIDNIILDLKKGEIVCAIDETGDARELELSKKHNEVFSKNRSGKGGELKYGIIIKEKKINLEEISQIPIFYLPLPFETLNRGIKHLISYFEKLNKPGSDYKEEKTIIKAIFNYWVSGIKDQIATIKMNLRPESLLRERAINFIVSESEYLG